MGLETGTYINSLNSLWPLDGDGRKQGDDHIRLVKSTLLNTFSGVYNPVTFTPAQANKLVGIPTTGGLLSLGQTTGTLQQNVGLKYMTSASTAPSIDMSLYNMAYLNYSGASTPLTFTFTNVLGGRWALLVVKLVNSCAVTFAGATVWGFIPATISSLPAGLSVIEVHCVQTINQLVISVYNSAQEF